MLTKDDKRYSDYVKTAYLGLELGVKEGESSEFDANRGRIQRIMSDIENVGSKKRKDLREEAKRCLKLAIVNDVPALDQIVREMVWRKYIDQIEFEDAKEEVEERVNEAAKEAKMVVMIITFLTGFFALAVVGLGTLNTSSWITAIQSLIIATACILLLLSSFNLFVERRKEAFRRAAKVFGIVTVVSLLLIYVALRTIQV
jgi:hypothetical protein